VIADAGSLPLSSLSCSGGSSVGEGLVRQADPDLQSWFSLTLQGCLAASLHNSSTSAVLRRRIGVFQNDKCRRLDPGPVRVGVQRDVLVIQWPDDLADVLSHLVLDLPVHGVGAAGVLGVVEEHVLVALAAGAALVEVAGAETLAEADEVLVVVEGEGQGIVALLGAPGANDLLVQLPYVGESVADPLGIVVYALAVDRRHMKEKLSGPVTLMIAELALGEQLRLFSLEAVILDALDIGQLVGNLVTLAARWSGGDFWLGRRGHGQFSGRSGLADLADVGLDVDGRHTAGPSVPCGLELGGRRGGIE